MLAEKLSGSGVVGNKTYVDDVFSTYLYTGNGSTQTIKNGIQLGDGITIDHTKEPYYQNTVLHLQGNGSDTAQNNTFIDSSTNNFTITRNGNTTQGTFSPFSKEAGKWGVNFNGSTDYLSAPANAAFGLGTGDFTIEAFIFPTANPTNGPGTLLDLRTGVYAQALALRINSSMQVIFYDGPLNVERAAGSITLNSWTHVAFVRASGVLKTYINGSLSNTVTVSSDFGSSQPCYIGVNNVAGYNFNGAISNVRIVKGTALYTANFTPSTTPLTAVSGTSLLALQDNRFKDNSSNNFTLTATGTPSVTPFSPFANSAAYSASVNGGGAYFDGTGDYLSAPASAAYQLTGDFTIECWFYPTASQTYHTILDQLTAAATGQGNWQLTTASSAIRINYDGTSYIEGGTFSINTWNHFAATRTGSTIALYMNGVRVNTTTFSGTVGRNDTFWVGAQHYSGPSYYSTGHVAGARVVKGTALYTSNFTPPTAPPTAVTNTSLLLNFTNGGIIDNSGMNNLETVGNAQISTAVKKFGTGSMYFDGTGDWLTSPTSSLFALDADFTIEGWINPNTFASTWHPVVACNATNGFFVGKLDSGQFGLRALNNANIVGTTLPTIGVWSHFAVTRSGTTVRVFINGVLGNSATSSISFVAGNLFVGSDNGTNTFNGYIDDLRITKGVARYTQDFVVPTAEYPVTNVSGTYSSVSAGKGGMVWVKKRTAVGVSHSLTDTVRGANHNLATDLTYGQDDAAGTSPTAYGTVSAFNSNGFNVLLGSNATYQGTNQNGASYSSWTFRKAPKFFDVVTYTGDGVAGRQISHSLGVAPGMIVVKRTDSSSDWITWHRSISFSDNVALNTTGSAGSVYSDNIASVTSTSFYIQPNYGTTNYLNVNGATYVAYLFAHDTSTDGIIQAGSFTTDASGNVDVNLGWEPQWMVLKTSAIAENWYIEDTLRGWTASSGSTAATNGTFKFLSANTSSAEGSSTGWAVNQTGFSIRGGAISTAYIYLAIRRPNKPPTSGTQVFASNARTGVGSSASITSAGFPPDMVMIDHRAGGQVTNSPVFSRLTGGNFLLTHNTNAESSSYPITLDMSGFSTTNGWWNGSSVTYIDWMFKRAPGFMDVVAGSYLQGNLNHNLGVTPELVIAKQRSTGNNNWYVWYKTFGVGVSSQHLWLDSTAAVASEANVFQTMSSNQIGLGNLLSGRTGIYYLFASLPGVSKVGSYTGNGSSQTIDCGFSTGARFVLIKRTDSTGDWFVWDTSRGIVAANDPHLSLNTTAAEVTTDDSIDPTPTGFIVNQVAATNINVTSATYIFLAIA